MKNNGVSKKVNYPKMLRKTVLVEVVIPDTGNGNIALPDDVKQEQKISATTGIVVATAKKCEEVKVGDFIWYKAYIGNHLSDDSWDKDKMFIVVSEDDILAVRNS